MSDVIDEEIRSNVKNVIELLKNKGCQVDYVDIDYLEYAIPLYQVIALGEASSNLARYDGVRYGLKIDDFKNIDQLYKQTHFHWVLVTK